MGIQRQILPASLAPRGLRREWAAAYVGVSPTKFDEMVADGRMPKPKRIDGRVLWDIRRVDSAFEALPDEAETNEWDALCNSSSQTGPAR